MPLYEYTCTDCSTDFETLVFTSNEKVECPKCESEAVEKLMSVPAAPQMKSLPMGGCPTTGPVCGPKCCRN
ncbi:MAG TPA: zinc ribbon domain-containing protein [Gemmatales bacterium]|nr:zinc ribbon domain-containing protein [Gemmatales bacterium]